MKTTFDQITEMLRGQIEDLKKTVKELREENNRLRQELEHKAFQDDF